MRQEIGERIWVLEKSEFELMSLNTHFYRQRILVNASQYVNKHSQDFRHY